MQIDKIIDHANKASATSFYIYDLNALEKRVQKFRSLFPDYFKIHFAVKSNFNPRFLEVIKNAGYGADVVSAGEIRRALEVGFDPSSIILSGVGKTKPEINYAIDQQISQINVESLAELERISRLAKDKSMKVSLRVNPNVDADTHPYIRTGLLENKFGIDFLTAEKILSQADQYNVIINGLTMHIGSQILDTKPFFEAAEKVIQLFLKYKSKLPSLEVLDLGGGLGLDYQSQSKDPELEDFERARKYAEGLIDITEKHIQSGDIKNVYLEPGRFLAARAGYLFTQVQYIKKTDHKNFVIVDTGMHHLMRPCLYNAHHNIKSIEQLQGSIADTDVFDIVGPICESSDVLGKARILPRDIKEDDWLVISEAGAYGAVMASDYNLRDRAPEYFWNDGQVS